MPLVPRRIDRIKDFKKKTVLVRIDSDVEIEKGRVVDDTRLRESLRTIDYILKHNGRGILVGHLGRPTEVKSEKFYLLEGKVKVKSYSLEPVAKWLNKKIKNSRPRQTKRGGQKSKIKNVINGGFSGWQITDRLFLLENIRFFKREETNNKEFSRKLASLGDIFVNDAFAVSHRNHASIAGVTKHLPSYAGFHLMRELETLSRIVENPKRPLVVLIGGAKIETKLPLVERMHKIADYVLVGGEIAQHARELIRIQHGKIRGRKSIVLVADLKSNGFDITEKSVENFMEIIEVGRTIVWNGPVGLIRPPIQNSKFKIQNSEDTERGTKELAHHIVLTKAYKVVGGGDTVAFLRRLGLLSKFDFVSTGGGAMLEFLSGKNLPGIIPLLK